MRAIALYVLVMFTIIRFTASDPMWLFSSKVFFGWCILGLVLLAPVFARVIHAMFFYFGRYRRCTTQGGDAPSDCKVN